MFERTIPRARAGELVRIALDRFRGEHRLDIRQHYTPESQADSVPTRRGINLPVTELPRLRSILEEAERAALEAGLLDEESYEACGLPIPQGMIGR